MKAKLVWADSEIRKLWGVSYDTNRKAIAANKVRGIRCGLCWDVISAKLTKEHNNANVISLGARMVSEELGLKIVDAWLNAEFEGGRHLRRIEKLESKPKIFEI